MKKMIYNVSRVILGSGELYINRCRSERVKLNTLTLVKINKQLTISTFQMVR